MKIDWISLIAILVMLSALIVVLFYVYVHDVNECISNPLTFASRQYQKEYGYPFEGTGWFKTPIRTGFTRVNFNSTSISFGYNVP